MNYWLLSFFKQQPVPHLPGTKYCRNRFMAGSSSAGTMYCRNRFIEQQQPVPQSSGTMYCRNRFIEQQQPVPHLPVQCQNPNQTFSSHWFQTSRTLTE